MKRNDAYKWIPEPGNLIQEAFADLLDVYEQGVTKNEWVALYSAFLGGIIVAMGTKVMLVPNDHILDLIRKEGVKVAKMMVDQNAQNQSQQAQNN
jgi:hypothetical protein